MLRAAPSARLVPVLTPTFLVPSIQTTESNCFPYRWRLGQEGRFPHYHHRLCAFKTRIYLVIGRNFARPALNLSVRIPKVLLPSVLPFRKYRHLGPKGKLAHKETLGKKPGEGERHSWDSPILSIQGRRTSFLVFSRFFLKIFQKRLNLELASGQR